MRRLSIVTGIALTVILIPAPSHAFFHNAVTHPVLHTIMDLITAALVSAPIWTVVLWARRDRALLAGLVAFIQLPAAMIGFATILDPVLHVGLGVTALVLTTASLVWVRRATRDDGRRATAPR